MFIFGFLVMFLHIIPCVKVYHMSRNTIFENRGKRFFSPIVQENDFVPNYDISHWVQQLHLQQCVFVEIGEGFCALFVELQSILRKTVDAQVAEFFLGICDCATLRSWKLCSPELTRMSKTDCTFKEATAIANTSARVHRRLCDITFLSSVAPICNCSIQMAGQNLYKTEGSSFPTCFLHPLPKSICSPRGVCGVARCTVKTINGIHSPQCDTNCHQRQPFCEELGPWTSVPPKVTSLWSKWSMPQCNVTCGKGSLVSTAFCYNQVTGRKAINCIGPGSFCCVHASGLCECQVTIENRVMKARRFTEPCTSSDLCPVIKGKNVLPEKRFQKSEDDDEYEEEDLQAPEDYEEPISLSSRRLLAYYYYDVNDYGIINKNDDDDEFEEAQNNKRMAPVDDEQYDDNVEYDPDLDASDDQIDKDEEDTENNEEDDMMNFTDAYEEYNLYDNDQASLKEVDVDAFQDVREELARKCSKKSKPEELSVYSIYDSDADSSGTSINARISLLGLTLFVTTLARFSFA